RKELGNRLAGETNPTSTRRSKNLQNRSWSVFGLASAAFDIWLPQYWMKSRGKRVRRSKSRTSTWPRARLFQVGLGPAIFLLALPFVACAFALVVVPVAFSALTSSTVAFATLPPCRLDRHCRLHPDCPRWVSTQSRTIVCKS